MAKSAGRSGAQTRSLAALAASLDTKKRPLPADANPPPAKQKIERALGKQKPPEVPRAAVSVGITRSVALSSMQRAPAPAPAKVPSPGRSSKPAAVADTRRRYPRAALQVRAKLSLADDPRHVFEASLPTVNISVGGMFLESSFFLKMGTKLLVTLQLPPKGREVRVKGEVVRIETSADGGSGFALRFTEYLDGSEVALATHFLSPVLREFLTAYAKEHRFDASAAYIAHTADVLAAWELKKAELGGDVWDLASPA